MLFWFLETEMWIKFKLSVTYVSPWCKQTNNKWWIPLGWEKCDPKKWITSLFGWPCLKQILTSWFSKQLQNTWMYVFGTTNLTILDKVSSFAFWLTPFQNHHVNRALDMMNSSGLRNMWPTKKRKWRALLFGWPWLTQILSFQNHHANRVLDVGKCCEKIDIKSLVKLLFCLEEVRETTLEDIDKKLIFKTAVDTNSMHVFGGRHRGRFCWIATKNLTILDPCKQCDKLLVMVGTELDKLITILWRLGRGGVGVGVGSNPVA